MPVSISAGIGVGELPGTIVWELRSLEGSTATVEGTPDAPEAALPFEDAVMNISAAGVVDARIDPNTFTADATMALTVTSGVADGEMMPFDSTLEMQVR